MLRFSIILKINSMTITKKSTAEELYKIVENIVHEDLPTRDKFSLDVINFINSNNQYYWFLLNVNYSLGLWQN